jgi:predicted nucleotidyltransferase
MIPEKDLIIRLLSALFPDATIYLFGSQARGTHRITSDIDIAIDTGRKLSSLELAQAQNIIQALNIPQTVDIVDFYALPEAMKNTILKEGIVWKG